MNHKRDLKIIKILNTILESVDSTVVMGATSTSIAPSIIGVGLTFLPISGGIACTLSLSNKVLHKLFINEYNKYRKQYERDQQTIKSVNGLYRKSLQDTVIDKNEHQSVCNIFTKYVDETKNESFL